MKKTLTPLVAVAIMLMAILDLSAQNVNPVNVIVNSPSGAIDWSIDGIQANLWDGDLNMGGPVTGKLVDMRDDSPEDSVAIYCCVDAILNPETIEGNIALISRGDCEFSDKAWHAEKNGAIASIIGNRAAIGQTVGTHTEGLVWMGAGVVADSVNTPSVFIAYEDHIVLRRMIENGEDVNVTIEAPYIYDVAAAYAHRTPEEQIVPLENISMALLNRDTNNLFDLTCMVDITDPSGNTTTLTETLDTLLEHRTFDALSGETLVTFDEGYTPSEVGEYTVTFTVATTGGNHPIDDESVTTNFWVTDNHTFAHDNGEIVFEQGVRVVKDAFEDPNVAGVYHVGGAYRTGNDDAMATAATFGLSNPVAIFNESGEAEFQIRLYNGDGDGDGALDTAFDPSDALGETTYTLTGDEVPNQLLTVMFDDPVTLAANGLYLLMIEQEGIVGDVFVSPAFTASGGSNTPASGSIYRLGDEYEIDGFEFWNDDTPGFPHGGRRPVAWLHLEGLSLTPEGILESSKLSLGPVPTTHLLTLNLELEAPSKEIMVAISDFQGRAIKTQRFENMQVLQHQFDVQDMNAGTYFLSVFTEEGYRAKKFQIVR